jgi:hypothetical protein
MRVRRSCQLVGGVEILLCRKFISVAAILAILVAAFGVSALAATATASALVSVTTGIDTSSEATTAAVVTTNDQQEAVLLEQCDRSAVKYRSKTWYWQNLMGRHKTRSGYKPAQPHTLAYCQWVLSLWQRRAEHAQAAARRWMRQHIQTYRRNVKHWRLVMGETSLLRSNKWQSGETVRPLAENRSAGAPKVDTSAAFVGLAMYPSLRGQLVRSGRTLLGRFANGSEFPARLRSVVAEPQRHG